MIFMFSFAIYILVIAILDYSAWRCSFTSFQHWIPLATHHMVWCQIIWVFTWLVMHVTFSHWAVLTEVPSLTQSSQRQTRILLLRFAFCKYASFK